MLYPWTTICASIFFRVWVYLQIITQTPEAEHWQSFDNFELIESVP